MRFDQQPFKPKIFGVCSYQVESPKELVAKHIPEPLFKSPQYVLDNRGVFIVQHNAGIYLWRGSKCISPEAYLKVALDYVKLINKYEKSSSETIVTI